MVLCNTKPCKKLPKKDKESSRNTVLPQELNRLPIICCDWRRIGLPPCKRFCMRTGKMPGIRRNRRWSHFPLSKAFEWFWYASLCSPLLFNFCMVWAHLLYMFLHYCATSDTDLCATGTKFCRSITKGTLAKSAKVPRLLMQVMAMRFPVPADRSRHHPAYTQR